MADKQIIIDGVDVSGCEFYFYREGDEYPHRCSCYKDMYGCSVVCNLADCCKNCVYKQLKRKELECEELTKNYLAVIQQRNAAEHQLDQLKVENKELRNKITEIFACLIKSNRVGVITDTLWVDDIMTLWDYIAQTLGIEGDQTQIEEQILQKKSAR